MATGLGKRHRTMEVETIGCGLGLLAAAWLRLGSVWQGEGRAWKNGWLLESLAARGPSAPWTDLLSGPFKNIARLLEPHLFARNLPHGAC